MPCHAIGDEMQEAVDDTREIVAPAHDVPYTVAEHVGPPTQTPVRFGVQFLFIAEWLTGIRHIMSLEGERQSAERRVGVLNESGETDPVRLTAFFIRVGPEHLVSQTARSHGRYSARPRSSTRPESAARPRRSGSAPRSREGASSG